MSKLDKCPAVVTRFSIAVLERGNGDLLLLKRAPDRAMGAGLWAFAAGHLEPGELPRQCVMRELREEIGPRHRLRLLNAMGPIRGGSGGGHVVHLFHFRWLGGTILLNAEHTAYTWVDKYRFRQYPVMRGIDADIATLRIWSRRFLHPRRRF